VNGGQAAWAARYGLTRMAQRRATLLAPVVYVVALVAWVAVNGLPLEHTVLFFWIVLGLAAASIRAWRSWGRMLMEWLPLLALLVLYDYLRGAVSVPDQDAHVSAQISFGRWSTGGHDATVWLQGHLYDVGHVHWYDVGIWCVYLSHFFVIWIVAAILWKVAHDRFRAYAAAVVTLTLMAFLTYWLYPAQAPWMAAEHGEIGTVYKIVPTVWQHLGVRTAADLFETGNGLVNLVAAMPSLHGAYPALLFLFFWRDGWKFRIPLALYTLAMGFTLVYGGEHFVLDILVGWLYAAIALAVSRAAVPVGRRLLALRRRSPAEAGDDRVAAGTEPPAADTPVSAAV
jgi:membrane-associated phospholipid phosphatase